MDSVPRPGRWRCPACGTGLEPAEPPSAVEQKLRCPACGGQFRVRRRRGRAGDPEGATISGEVPAVRNPEPPPTVGGLSLKMRTWALLGVEIAFTIGNVLGGCVLFVLGGFVPVIGGWLRDEVTGWSGILTALGGVSVRVPTTDPDADLGPAIARNDAPELFDEVADVARRLGARPPQQLRLTYLPCCGVVAWKRSRALVLGLPLLDVLNRAEMRAVLAHELAHLALGDATRSARLSRFVQGLDGALDEKKPSKSPLNLWAKFCRVLADPLHAPIARGQEARADRASAAIAGGDAAASALVKVAAVQPIFREVLEHYDPDDPDAPNLYAFFRAFWSRLPEELRTALRHQLLTSGLDAADASHPPLIDRLATVQSYPQKPFREPDLAPAWTALGDREAMERMLHNRLFAVPAVEPSLFHRAGT